MAMQAGFLEGQFFRDKPLTLPLPQDFGIHQSLICLNFVQIEVV